MYVSREDGDVITYDLRMVKPNQGGYLENAGLHTLEHLFATYVRNTEEAMRSCMWGRWAAAPAFTADERYAVQSTSLALVQETMAFIARPMKGRSPVLPAARMRQLPRS